MKAKLLVLEDDVDLREMMTQVLTDEGYWVVAVDNALSAVEEAAKQPFDLIVADIRMKGMDGLEAIERTKASQPQIGTMVVSGYASAEETRRADELQVGAYLRKPFRMKQFLQVVREQLASFQVNSPALKSECALYWALEELALLCGGQPEAAELAFQLATRAEWPGTWPRQLQLATLWLSLPEGKRSALPWDLFHGDELSVFCSALRERGSRERTWCDFAVSAQAVGLSQASQQLPEGELRQVALQTPQPVQSERRSLLALAKTLHRSGQQGVAQQAYARLREQTQDALEAAQASLGLAEFAFLQAAPLTEVEAHCRESYAWSLQLGPKARSQIQLDLVCWLSRAGSPVALQMIPQVREAHLALGLSSGVCLCDLLLGQAAPESLQGLLPSSGGWDYLQRHPWLWQKLLALDTDDSALQALVVHFQGSLRQSLQQGLSAPMRQRLVQLLLKGETAGVELVADLGRDELPEVRQAAAQLSQRLQQQREVPLLRIYSLGNLEVCLGDCPVAVKDWKTRPTQYLFALLASSIGKGWAEERVVDWFWPDSDDKGRRNLNWSLSVIRTCLQKYDFVHRSQGELGLSLDLPIWHDLDEFRKAREAGLQAHSQGLTRDALSWLRQAERLSSRGSYLDGCYMDWALQLRNEVEEQAVEVALHLGQLLQEQNLWEEAVEVLRGAFKAQTHRQDLCQALMLAYLGAGRAPLAVDVFRRCETVLRREYEMEPSIDLVKVYLQVKSV